MLVLVGTDIKYRAVLLLHSRQEVTTNDLTSAVVPQQNFFFVFYTAAGLLHQDSDRKHTVKRWSHDLCLNHCSGLRTQNCLRYDAEGTESWNAVLKNSQKNSRIITHTHTHTQSSIVSVGGGAYVRSFSGISLMAMRTWLLRSLPA